MHRRAVLFLVAAASCTAGAVGVRRGRSSGSDVGAGHDADSLLDTSSSNGERWTGLKALWLASTSGVGNPPVVVPSAPTRLPAPSVDSRPRIGRADDGSSTELFGSRGYLPFKGWAPPEDDKPEVFLGGGPRDEDIDDTLNDDGKEAGQDVDRHGGVDEETPEDAIEWRLSDEELVQRTATDSMDFVYHVPLPPQWDNMIAENSIALSSMSPVSEVWTARLRNYGQTVSFKVMRSDDIHAQRELHMRKRIHSLVNLGAVTWAGLRQTLDIQVYETNTYFLFRTAGGNLRMHLNQRRAKQAWSTEPLMRPEVALNLLVDLLHGCQNLDRAGVVHADLTEHNVLLSQGRAYITDFGTSCLVHSGDHGFGCDVMEDTAGDLIGSAYHHAPEMLRGKPTGPENHIWQLGLIFAEISLGFPPMGLLRTFHEQPDSDEFVRSKIEKIVREEFRIEDAPGFRDADSEVQELLRGMLEKDVKRRWTASRTLTYVKELCGQTGVVINPRDDGVSMPVGG